MANKRLIYVGGLDNSVTETMLHGAFIPFGELKSCEVIFIMQHRHYIKTTVY